ncbi:MAG TPA: choline dehydrogenase [Alphaproteobacteria bacterium]|nr:choline dehydrogenase [Alphaproteobacteria bacterium]|tara:strand:+ start:169 stop:1827 length:1659 start_codon:yes stop_codon:yes gene_type:complete
MDGDYDYIIIGSGSAGSALAYRLGEDGTTRVLVLEYGGSDAGPLIQMPAALSYPMNMKRYDWGYLAEPEPALGGRSLVCPRGKVIGGSSSINGMIYVRGHAGDYAHWEESGAAGWGYADVLPYFRRMEHSHGGEEPWRGTSGPLHVTRGPRDNPLHDAFVKSAEAAGYAATPDYNGHRQEGFGPADMTVWKGRRWSAANAYLKPAMKRGNLRLVTGAMVERILFEGGRAVGVAYYRGGARHEVRAKAEVVLSAGAINSPAILQRSGIGPGPVLQAAGVTPLVERNGVGANLQDHLEVYFQIACLQPITLYRHLGLLAKARIGAEWLFFKTGLGASNQFETLGFIRSAAGIAYPDIQYHFLPVAISYDGTAPAEGHGFQLHVGPMRSKSRGHVHIRDDSVVTSPEIRFNYMSHPDDWEEFRRCIRLSRDIIQQPPMDPYRGAEIQPGETATSDEDIDGFIRDHAESAYHPCGTVRMGAVNDPMAVVDPQCRVIGVEGLRVADSSIFPRITNGNLNAPSIMTGEKAADHILGRAPLARANDTPFFHPGWQSEQR